MNDLAKKLLDAHVAYELSRLQGSALIELIETRTQAVLDFIGEVPLEQVVPREYVFGVIERYVIELRVSGGITELAGEMARLVFRSHANAKATLVDIFPERSFSDFTEEVIKFEDLRKEIIQLIASSTTLMEVVRNVISRVVNEALTRGTEKLSPTHGIAQRLQRSFVPDLTERAENLVQRQLNRHRAAIAERLEAQLTRALDEDALRSFAEEMWQRVAKRPLTETFALVGEQGVEDFVIFCYEYWMEFRRTPYLRQILREATGAFFDKYGAEDISVLIEDMGVSHQLIIDELKLLIPQRLEHATRTGFLEQQVRAHLADFYESPTCAALLK